MQACHSCYTVQRDPILESIRIKKEVLNQNRNLNVPKRPLVDGHGASTFFVCGHCRKALCNYYTYKTNPPERCDRCGGKVSWK